MRAVETARVIAEANGLVPQVCDGLCEVRFGSWEGKPFAELDQDPEWRRFNTTKSQVRPPGGELMIEAQARIVSAIEKLRCRHPDAMVALVSHLDPLRMLISHCLGMPLDFLLRFDLSPGSISVVQYSQAIPLVLSLNHNVRIPV